MAKKPLSPAKVMELGTGFFGSKTLLSAIELSVSQEADHFLRVLLGNVDWRPLMFAWQIATADIARCRPAVTQRDESWQIAVFCPESV